MREELEELLEAKGWRIVDVRSGPGAGGEAGSGCECGDRIDAFPYYCPGARRGRRWRGGRQ